MKTELKNVNLLHQVAGKYRHKIKLHNLISIYSPNDHPFPEFSMTVLLSIDQIEPMLNLAIVTNHLWSNKSNAQRN